jgi:hypothetical protein
MVRVASRRTLTVTQQALALASAFPEYRPRIVRSRLVWVGELQPSPVSEIYAVRIQYAGRERPAISLLDPPSDAGDDSLPHTFEDHTLCLHYPWEWCAHQLIVSTIVPWTSEWLFYYELFKITGRWHGGGHGESEESLPTR